MNGANLEFLVDLNMHIFGLRCLEKPQTDTRKIRELYTKRSSVPFGVELGTFLLHRANQFSSKQGLCSPHYCQSHKLWLLSLGAVNLAFSC